MQQNQKKNFTDLISGIVIMALAAFFYWTTFGIKSFLGTGRGRTSPDLIPKIVAVAMFVIGAVIVVQWLVRVKRGKVEPVVVQRETEESTGLNAQQLANRRLFQQITMPVTLVLIFCYIFAMSRIGFTLSTFAFLTFQITLLSTDLSASSWLKSLAIALIASVGIYLIFGCAFSLAVPKVSFVDLGLSELYRMVLN
ncbi:MAG TPA: tripartite tricarboxylate transporter TctB family protein [Candidatus Ventricola gallistercoris]|nr:tripartite tricarboxylate transporter TctB family protein [Candidatus Ventricola gallistercoris]